MKSSDVISLLRAKHASDVFAHEVKDGPTWNGSPMRLDGWAMRRSWTRPCMTGYEVKVSRSDWLADKKWPAYVNLVNEFYLVAPDGVILESEVPDGIGFLRVAKTGTRLFTVRKAAWREPDPGAVMTLMQYVLQSRATIDAPRTPNTVEGWKQWLAEKEEKRRIGYNVSRGIRERYERDVEAVRREIESARSARVFADRVKAEAEKLGVRWRETWIPEFIARDLADVVHGVLSEKERIQIRSIIPLLQKVTNPTQETKHDD